MKLHWIGLIFLTIVGFFACTWFLNTLESMTHSVIVTGIATVLICLALGAGYGLMAGRKVAVSPVSAAAGGVIICLLSLMASDYLHAYIAVTL